jgi:hypothetical protein
VNRNFLWRPLRRSESGVDGFRGIARAARCGELAVGGLLKNASSMLHGFDSFEAVPEAFNNTHGKFAFSTHGVVTIVEDPGKLLQAGLRLATLSLIMTSWLSTSTPIFIRRRKQSSGS